MSSPSVTSRGRVSNLARLAGALAVASVAISLAACGEAENFIDQDQLEAAVLDLAPANAGAESASCPEEVSSDSGTEFECTVSDGENEVQVGATVISESDEEVQFEILTVDGEKYP